MYSEFSIQIQFHLMAVSCQYVKKALPQFLKKNQDVKMMSQANTFFLFLLHNILFV
jgi:hypothetical protein